MPSADDILAEEELRRQVVAAVLALDEPFRTTVLLRYYEGFATRAIAQRLGVAEATVRTRLFRAHALLRLQLGVAAAGQPAHEDKAPALLGLPFRGLPSLVPLMSAKKTIAACVAILMLGWLWLEVAPPPAAVVAVAAPAQGPSLGEASSPGTELASRSKGLAEARPPHAQPPVFPAERVPAALHGIVLDELDDRQVASVAVRLSSTPGRLPAGFELGDDRNVERLARTAADGRFEFRDVPSGLYDLTATASDGRQASRQAAAGPEPGEDVVLALRERRPALRIRVQDEDGGRVPGARVEIIGNVPKPRPVGMCGMEPVVATTDACGECVVEGQVGRSSLVTATTPSGLAGRATLWDVTHELCVTVAARGSIEATLTGLPEAELAWITLSAWAMSLPASTYEVQHGIEHSGIRRGGIFVFADLPSGHYELLLAPRSKARLVFPRMLDMRLDGRGHHANSVCSWPIELKPGQIVRTQLSLARAGRIEGRVHDGDDRPVAGARVLATFAPPFYPAAKVLHGVKVWRLDSPSNRAGLHPAAHVEATTDASGRYVLDGLQPGRHRIEVFTQRLTHDRRENVEAAAGETTRLEHRLEPSGVLQGVVRSRFASTWVGVVRPDADSPCAIAIAPNGLFTFPGLAAGCYRVCELQGERPVPWVELGRADVVAGRTTWVDLRDAPAAVELVGVLTGADGPVAGARVQGATGVTGPDGVFRIRGSFPYERSSRLCARIGSLDYEWPLPQELAETSRARAVCRLGPHALRVEARSVSGENAALLSIGQAGRQNAGKVAGKLRLVSGLAELRHLWQGSYGYSVLWPSGYACHGTVLVPEQRELILTEMPVGELEITISDATSRPPTAKWRVAAWTWRGKGPAPADVAALEAEAHQTGATTDFDGRCLVRGVVAGEVLVVATPSGGGGAQRCQQRLTLRQGQRLAVSLRP